MHSSAIIGRLKEEFFSRFQQKESESLATLVWFDPNRYWLPSLPRLIEESPKKVDQGIWHGVAGMRGVKTVLERDIILPLRDREMAKRFKVRLPRGVLFYGPLGCGKTHMARKLADANINVTANGKRSRKRGQKTLELHANMSYVNIQ